MIEYGVIEASSSPDNAPVVIIKKKDKTNRVCLAFRRLNLVTKFDSEPMGNVEDIISNLRKDKIFSKINLAKGYWQIPVHEASRPMTASTRANGCYQFKRLPFGLQELHLIELKRKL